MAHHHFWCKMVCLVFSCFMSPKKDCNKQMSCWLPTDQVDSQSSCGCGRVEVRAVEQNIWMPQDQRIHFCRPLSFFLMVCHNSKWPHETSLSIIAPSCPGTNDNDTLLRDIDGQLKVLLPRMANTPSFLWIQSTWCFLIFCVGSFYLSVAHRRCGSCGDNRKLNSCLARTNYHLLQRALILKRLT